ncbi:MAG: DUF892 family protein [Pseudomonadota bacterium]
MNIQSLHDLYIHGIQDMRTGCAKTFSGMEAMRDAATDATLKQIVEGGLGQMHAAMSGFDAILARHGVEPESTGNLALKSLSDEAHAWMDGTYASETLRDLAILEKTRNIAAYPDAGFTAFVAQAKALGYDADVADLGGDQPPTGNDPRAMMAEVEQALLAQLPKAA